MRGEDGRMENEKDEWTSNTELHTHNQTHKTPGQIKTSAFDFHQRLALGPGSVCDK